MPNKTKLPNDPSLVIRPFQRKTIIEVYWRHLPSRNRPPKFLLSLRIILGLFRDYIDLVLPYLFQMQMEFKSTLVGFYNKHESMFVTLWCVKIS